MVNESPLESASNTVGEGQVTFGQVFRLLGPAGPLAIVAASLPALGGWLLLGTAVWVAPWLKSHGTAGLAIYIAGFALSSGLALLPTYAQAVVGGWAFGSLAGAGAAIAGFGGGSLIGYVIARRAAGDRVLKLIAEYPKWQAVYEELLGCRFWKSLAIVTLVRLPPNSPFAITNLVLAATRVRPLVFGIGTLVGMTPRTVICAVIGAGVADVTQVNSRPAWLTMTGVAAMVVVLVLIGALANRAVNRIAQR